MHSVINFNRRMHFSFMAEYLQNNIERLESLTDFTRDLIEGKEVKSLFSIKQNIINTITPAETMQVFDSLLNEGIPLEKVKSNVGKIINVFYKSLNSFEWEKPVKGHFLYYLMVENREAEKHMNELKIHIKAFNSANGKDFAAIISKIKEILVRLREYDLHYIKKENLLFPYIEKTFPQYRCLQLMWSFHDDYRECMKNLQRLLTEEKINKTAVNKEIGKLFFVIMPIIFREEQIIYPVARRSIPEKVWKEMYQQSFEIGWCYIEPPVMDYKMEKLDDLGKGSIDLGTGILNPEQIMQMLNHLPVDITFVDENDEVCYFSGGTHRIFPRSTAILGRKVQNCHPPESVHIVNEIIETFKTGKKDVAEFWIQMKGRFIHIRYFAIRNAEKVYKGTLEVSQDVTEIRSLQGEKRLLDWKN